MEEQLGDERDGAGEHRRVGHHPHVEVADVRDLVGRNALELLLVEALQQPARDHHQRLILVASRRQCVRR